MNADNTMERDRYLRCSENNFAGRAKSRAMSRDSHGATERCYVLNLATKTRDARVLESACFRTSIQARRRFHRSITVAAHSAAPARAFIVSGDRLAAAVSVDPWFLPSWPLETFATREEMSG